MICNWKNAAMKSTARKSVFDLHQDLHYNLCSLTMADIIWMVEKPTSIFALLKVNVLFLCVEGSFDFHEPHAKFNSCIWCDIISKATSKCFQMNEHVGLVLSEFWQKLKAPFCAISRTENLLARALVVFHSVTCQVDFSELFRSLTKAIQSF